MNENDKLDLENAPPNYAYTVTDPNIETVCWQESYLTVMETDGNGDENKTKFGCSSGKIKIRSDIKVYITGGKIITRKKSLGN